MALKPCRECGKEVSSEAPSCPHCGVVGPIRSPDMVRRCPKCGYANEPTADECVNSNEGPFGKTFYCRTDLRRVAAASDGGQRTSTHTVPGDFVCLRCRSVGSPRKVTRGLFAIELVLWLLLIIPGLVYTLWRVTSGRRKMCRTCGSEEIVPADSRRGRELLAG